jgi:hypothetical protein
VQVNDVRHGRRCAHSSRPSEHEEVQGRFVLLRLHDVDGAALDERFGEDRRLPGECLGRQHRLAECLQDRAIRRATLRQRLVDRDAVDEQAAIHAAFQRSRCSRAQLTDHMNRLAMRREEP